MTARASSNAGPLTLSIVIPAFNEEKRLGRTMAEALSYLRLQPYEAEILIVDDGSSDRTAAIVTEFAAQASGRLKLLRNLGNRGKGFAVRHGVMNARGQVILFCDADLATPFSEVPKVLGPILENRCDVAIGSRQSAQRATQSRVRQFLGTRFSSVRNVIVGVGFGDTQCGFKALRRNAAHAIFAQLTIDGFAFDVEMLLLAEKQKWRCIEVAVEWEDQAGSTVSPIASSLRMLRDLLRIRASMAQRAARTGRPSRTASRVAVRLVGPDGTAEDTFLRNVNRGGLFVATEHRIPRAAVVTVIVPLIDGELLPLYAKGAHAHAEGGVSGLGLEFTELDGDTIVKLDRFIERLEAVDGR